MFTNTNTHKIHINTQTAEERQKRAAANMMRQQGNQTGKSGFLSSAWNFVQNTANSMVDQISSDPNLERMRKEIEIEKRRQQLEELNQCKVIFEHKSWIWVNAHFVDSEKVAFERPEDAIDCSPYLEIIKKEYQPFKQLFVECGVRNQFEFGPFFFVFCVCVCVGVYILLFVLLFSFFFGVHFVCAKKHKT